MTRWIGGGVGAALILVATILVFTIDCVSSAQSHVLAVVLALGVALVLWGAVGGLQVDLKLHFKALGEVTAAGAAAIFLVVHFVTADGIVPDCKDEPTTGVLYGRVFDAEDNTVAVAGAKVTLEFDTRLVTHQTNDDGWFEAALPEGSGEIMVWAQKSGYQSSLPLQATLPLPVNKVRIPMAKAPATPSTPPWPGPRPFPTFVREWGDVLAMSGSASYESAMATASSDPRELANWSRRAYAAQDWEWSAKFLEAARTADPSGASWLQDLPYLASAYTKMGRATDASAVTSTIAEALASGDPRLSELQRARVGETMANLGLPRTHGPRGFP